MMIDILGRSKDLLFNKAKPQGRWGWDFNPADRWGQLLFVGPI